MAVNQKIDYQRYLASREWRVKRKKVIERNDGLCYRCLSADIKDVHHVTYERLGHEELDDLIGVCQPCHEYLSAEREDDPAAAVIMALLKQGITPAIHPDGYILWWHTAELPNGRCFAIEFQNSPSVDSFSFCGYEVVLPYTRGVWMRCWWM